MNAKGHRDLFDDPFGFDKDFCPIVNQGGYQSPKDHPRRKKGEVGMNILLEKLGVQDPHRQNRDGQAQCDPPWTQGRASVALPDIESPQGHPDAIGEKTPEKILFGFCDLFFSVKRRG